MPAKNEPGDLDLRALMQAAQGGDRAAYNLLLREIAPLVKGVIRRQRSFLPAEDIEDLVQDVLLSLHSVRATYDPGRPFLPWLMAIVRNRMADLGRRHARLKANELAVAQLPETFAPGQTKGFEEVYGQREALRIAMAGLTDGQRRALDLVKLKEMSLKEASAASGMSIAALKVAVHRAIKALRATLKRRM